MKKIGILFLLATLVNSSFSYAQTEGWPEWTPTECYENIEYRARLLKKNGTRYEWQIQFRNFYDRHVFFNYGTQENKEDLPLTTHRKSLRAGEVSTATHIFTNSPGFFLYTDKLSFNMDGSEIYPCD